MTLKLPPAYHPLPEVASALTANQPVVALESAVITHGLPRGTNLDLARNVEALIRANGVTPATISVINGSLCIGTSQEDLERLATDGDLIKVSIRNIGFALAKNLSGGTTVAATLLAARTAGIKVFSTGGIGGVHRGRSYDISADLDELARSPVVVVCAGAKAILDLPATREALETRGVPVLGYQTTEFPAFYSRRSGLHVDARVDSPAEIAAVAQAHWEAGNHSAILVCNPLPEDQALDDNMMEKAIQRAMRQAETDDISGASLTPALLDMVMQLTDGKSLQANLALLQNNASLAAEIAVEMFPAKKKLVTY